MPPQRYEIYWAAIPFRNCDDARPWIVIGDPYPDGKVTVYPISGHLDLMRPTYFLIPEDDPGFGATGLQRRSFVIDDYPVSIPLAVLTDRMGTLMGDLLDDFKEWNGDT